MDSRNVKHKVKRYLAAAIALAVTAWVVATIVRNISEEAAEVVPPYSVKGIDVSSHNGEIDFNAVKADSVEFVMIKASEGATFKDPMFHRNFHNAKDAGLKVGAYHFFRFEVDGNMQALNLINSVRGKKLDLPLAIDVEEWSNPHPTPTTSILRQVHAMAATLERSGYPVVIYTNRKGFRRFVAGALDCFPLWICSFTDPPVYPGEGDCRLWQYSHKGTVNGIKSKVDKNVYVGTRQQFNDWIDSLNISIQY